MDSSALNYELYATNDDGSCLFITPCVLPGEYDMDNGGITGVNMIVGLLPDAINALPITNDQAYIVAISDDGMCLWVQ